jgi:hypothetical protein
MVLVIAVDFNGICNLSCTDFMYEVCHFQKIREDGLELNVFIVRIILNRQEPKLQ